MLVARQIWKSWGGEFDASEFFPRVDPDEGDVDAQASKHAARQADLKQKAMVAFVAAGKRNEIAAKSKTKGKPANGG